MNRLLLIPFFGAVSCGLLTLTASARPAYAKQEGKQCGFCHVNPAGGGPRTFRGMYFGANHLTLEHFDEVREARLAGVEVNASGGAAIPEVGYIGNVSGPAFPQIGLAALNGPVVVIFLDGASEGSEQAAATFHEFAKMYGPGVTFTGVQPGSAEDAVKLSTKLDSNLRVLPDIDGRAVKKLGATHGFDIVVMDKLQDRQLVLEGFSRSNMQRIAVQLKSYGISTPDLKFDKVSEKLLRGKPLTH